MTTVTIKSDSEKKTQQLIKLAKELGLAVKTTQNKELDLAAMVNGIGRKATDEELIDYLAKQNDNERITLQTAFAKYFDKK